MKITYPVPIDSNHRIWNAFNNEYWPADYFIDAKGRIRHHHFGEGEYGESERVIQERLKENGATGVNETTVSISADGAETPPPAKMCSLPKLMSAIAVPRISHPLNKWPKTGE